MFQSLPGTLQSGRAFDTGCGCVLNETTSGEDMGLRHCVCLVRLVYKHFSSMQIHINVWVQAPRLSAQHAFMKNLGNICYKLMKHSTKELKSKYVYVIAMISEVFSVYISIT